MAAVGIVEEASAVALLRRNDPSESRSVNIFLHCEESDAALAQALEQNEYTQEIQLYFLNLTGDEDWPNLLRFLSTSQKLNFITLSGAARNPFRDTTPVQPGLVAQVSQFLAAVQGNANIKRCSLVGLRLPGEVFASFLDNAAISCLGWASCQPVPAESGADTSGALVEAFQRNRTIQNVSVFPDPDDPHIAAIVRALAPIVSLRGFGIVCKKNMRRSEEFCRAVQHLLGSTKSIKVLQIDSWIGQDQDFRYIADGLINSESVAHLIFSRCQFRTEESTHHLNRIFQTKRNLNKIVMDGVDFGSDSMKGSFHGTLEALLLKPDSPLQDLDLRGVGSMFPHGSFGSLLRAAEQSDALESLTIEGIESPLQFAQLIERIPSMKVQKLVFACNRTDEKPAFLAALKRNSSLVHVDGKLNDGGSLFNEEDKAKLDHYSKRNKRLARWIDNPSSIPRFLWPEALAMAKETNPTVFYRAFEAISSEITATKINKRKRKRPQFYAPP